MTEHMPPQSEDVILRMGDTEWLARYLFLPNRHSGALTGGWKQFVIENYMREFDVCVFNLANPGRKPMTLDVKIFKVDV